MSFSADLKSEIISKKIKKPCCKLAALSAFIRTSGSILTKGKKIGFNFVCEADVAEFFQSIIEKLYGERSKKETDKSGRVKITCLSDTSFNILVDAKIIEISGEGISVRLDIDDGLVENECCLSAFIIGAFLGSGSVTVPTIDKTKTTGYHLEVVFLKYVTAGDFADLLSRKGFLPKTVERKDKFVVYLKNAEEISDFIAMLGANKSYLSLTDILIKKEVRNEENRKLNCEMSNLSKQIDAFLKTREEIYLIEESIGLDALGEALKSVCLARLENEDASLSELADILGVTKSCLNHRLRKISEIAKNLR
ncbi:MAG: DNA-binding protein WhiA [Clostridia bacterium]|nr:DNA-binding protein WhiA [Clostridia bacterium]